MMSTGEFQVRTRWEEGVSEGNVLHLILDAGTLQEEVLRCIIARGTVFPRLFGSWLFHRRP